MSAPQSSQAPDSANANTRAVTYACDLKSARAAAAELCAFLRERGLTDDEIFACELALVEAGNNAVQFVPAHRKSEGIVAEATCDATQVELRVTDHTDGFELPVHTQAPGPEIEAGRGLFLVQSVMDRVHYVKGTTSNTLVMVKARAT